ncbi:MAG: EamA family transporter, partial [Chloroflexota bacterium]
LIVTAATVSTLTLWLLTGRETFVPWPLGWIAIVFQGIITTFIGRLITYRAIGIIGSGQYALLAPLETTLTLVWAALFLQEWLSYLQWLGAVLVLTGVFLASDLVWEKLRLRV